MADHRELLGTACSRDGASARELLRRHLDRTESRGARGVHAHRRDRERRLTVRAAVVSAYEAPPEVAERPEPQPRRGPGGRRAARRRAQPGRPRDRVGPLPGRQPAASVRARDRGRRHASSQSARFAPGTRVWASGRGLGVARRRRVRRALRRRGRGARRGARGGRPTSSPRRSVRSGLAAWMSLSWLAPVRPGEAVLVLGATGSVGSVAVQAAKLLGAGRVVAVGRDAATARGGRARSAPTRPSRSRATTSSERLAEAVDGGAADARARPAAAGRRSRRPLPSPARAPASSTSGSRRRRRRRFVSGLVRGQAAPDPRLLQLRRAARRARAGLRGRGRARGRRPASASTPRRVPLDRVGDAWARQAQRPRRQARPRPVTGGPRRQRSSRWPTPVIMPKLGAYTEDILLAQWLVDEGQEVDAGQRRASSSRPTRRTPRSRPRRAGFVHRLSPRGRRFRSARRSALIAATRAEYDALARRRRGRRSEGEDDGGNPFLGYIGHGGGAAVAEAAGAVVPARRRARTGAPPAPSRAAARSSRRAPARCSKQLGLSLDDAREIAGSGPGRPHPRPRRRRVGAAAPRHRSRACRRGGRADGRRGRSRCRGRRGTIATRMVSSLQTAAQLTSVLELDVKPLVELRSRLNADGRDAADRRHGDRREARRRSAPRASGPQRARRPRPRSSCSARSTSRVAVETDEGLVAPVVAGADRLSLEEINDADRRARSARARRRARRRTSSTAARSRSRTAASIRSTSRPRSSIRRRSGSSGSAASAIARSSSATAPIAVRPTMQACLTFDHRAVDGGPAAAFLATLEGSPRLPRPR